MPAKVFLIDTILNDLSIPQVYYRTKIDANTQTTVREVVDGQQRLRAILEFASDRLQLTSKSPNFKGKTYTSLSREDQERFLSYQIPVVQLLNASDAEVLEVFTRLNSYSVKVTPAELRHAEFSEPVKWAIYDAARHWSILWSELKVISTRDTVRLKHNSLIAEMFMALHRGIGDGGEPNITKYYKSNKKIDENQFFQLREKLDFIIQQILDNTQERLSDTVFYDSPNFLMLFSAVGFLEGLSPKSIISQDVNELHGSGLNWFKASEKLSEIAQAFDGETDESGLFANFVAATKSSTHRVSSRKPRFTLLVKLLSNDEALT